MDLIKLTKVRIHKTEQVIDYMDQDTAIEALEMFKTKYNVPIFDLIKVLRGHSTIGYIAIGNGDLYYNFHVSKIRKKYYFAIKDGNRQISFDMSDEQVYPKMKKFGELKVGKEEKKAKCLARDRSKGKLD